MQLGNSIVRMLRKQGQEEEDLDHLLVRPWSMVWVRCRRLIRFFQSTTEFIQVDRLTVRITNRILPSISC